MKTSAITIKGVPHDVAKFVQKIPYGMRARTITNLLLAARVFANAYGPSWYAEVVSGRVSLVSQEARETPKRLPKDGSSRTPCLRAGAQD